MRKTMTALLMTLCLIGTMGTAFAGERAGAVTVSPFVGGYVFDGVQNLETRAAYGLRFGYDFSSFFALEATANYVPTRSESGSSLLDIINYRLEGVFNLIPNSPMVPYLSIGGGGQTLVLNDTDRTYVTANAGAGIKWFVNDDVAIRLDYHQNFIRNDDNILASSKHDWLANYEGSLGLQFNFGGK